VGLTAIDPVDLDANVGDEIRFLNDKTQPIRVILIEAGKSIACNKGFNGLIDQQADIKPGQYASFCFSKPGTMKYMARDQTAVTGGEVVQPGQIFVKSNTSKAISDTYPSVGRSEEGNLRTFTLR
jgi:plastocyanin